MRTRYMLTALAALFQIQNQPVIAGGLTGNELYSACNSDSPILKQSCGKYILGIAEGLRLGVSLAGRNGDCIPEDVRESQLVLMVQKRMKEEPQHLHLPAAALVAASITQVFPCPKPN